MQGGHSLREAREGLSFYKINLFRFLIKYLYFKFSPAKCLYCTCDMGVFRRMDKAPYLRKLHLQPHTVRSILGQASCRDYYE